MNERLAKLTEQCYEYNETMQGTWFNKTKFAELILQDCMDVVDGYTKGRTFDTHYDAVAQIEALFGIKHFGIE